MTIKISVDELDIRSLELGQDVTVSLDALPGQSFSGKIVSIDTEGSYDSGNTKYAVTVRVDRTEQMLSGMNAGIRIELGAPTSCLTVPEAALVEKGGKTWVYTSYDAETDTLGGLTQVQTGLADGTNAQIVSGLQSGDVIYYRYADSITYSFVPFNNV